VEVIQKPILPWFFKSVEQEMEALQQQSVMSWEDRLMLFQLQRAVYHHPIRSPRMKAGDQTIVRMSEQLDLVYLLEKAVIIEEKRSRTLLLQDENHDLETETSRWLSASEGVTHPAIGLYRTRFAADQEPDLPMHMEMRAAFVEQFSRLSGREQKLHLLYLINDAKRLIRHGQLDITALLPLYKIGLETNLLLHEGQLTRNTYTSIVMASNTKGEFDFSHQFIASYSRFVDEAIREDCERWARAHTTYWSRQLNECLALLVKKEFNTPHFQLIGRVLRAQAYFDLYLEDHSYRDYLFSYLDSYERWLYRKKEYSDSFKMAFLNFVQKCRQLLDCYEAPDFEKAQIEGLLDDTVNIQALNWLRHKQREIGARRKVIN